MRKAGFSHVLVFKFLKLFNQIGHNDKKRVHNIFFLPASFYALTSLSVFWRPGDLWDSNSTILLRVVPVFCVPPGNQTNTGFVFNAQP